MRQRIRRGRNGDIKFIKNTSQEVPVVDDRVVQEYPIETTKDVTE